MNGTAQLHDSDNLLIISLKTVHQPTYITLRDRTKRPKDVFSFNCEIIFTASFNYFYFLTCFFFRFYAISLLLTNSVPKHYALEKQSSSPYG